MDRLIEDLLIEYSGMLSVLTALIDFIDQDTVNQLCQTSDHLGPPMAGTNFLIQQATQLLIPVLPRPLSQNLNDFSGCHVCRES